jgi:dihydroorotate dehydrogenase
MLLRAKLFGSVYRGLLKPIFFLFDPEDIHDFVSWAGNLLGKIAPLKWFCSVLFNYEHVSLRQNILGVEFKNPIGLAAGFDKDAKLTQILPSVGFGFEEIGSLTAKSYAGNKKPRLYRLPEQKTLRVNYGLKNFGAEYIYNKLKKLKFSFPVGISIAKTNAPETSNIAVGIEDYFFTYKTFSDVGQYFTINISCPNTCEEKPVFAEPENLNLLLAKIFSIPKTKPVFVKISPDLEPSRLLEILTVCEKYPVDGFVCTNLTKKNVFNHQGKGGFSGKAVEDLSNQTIATVYKYFGGKKIVVGCGGIFTAEDAYKKIKMGASLLQLITGMIFQGPQLIGEINSELVVMLKRDGFKNISEAVGVESK